MSLPVVNMLWIGTTLGRIELLSIASWQLNGHSVRLHIYDAVNNVPQGVEIADAEKTVPQAQIRHLRHKKTGSYALASDYFRYRLQALGTGLWSDLDVVCLKPIEQPTDCLFGLEDKQTINGAILYLAPKLAITTELEGLFRDNFVPAWIRPSRARKLRLRRLCGFRLTPSDMPWGAFGPQAITELARKHELFGHARPRHVFYPLGYWDAQKLFDPSFALEPLLKEDTLTVHLWNEMLKDLRHTPPPLGAPLAKLYARFGI